MINHELLKEVKALVASKHAVTADIKQKLYDLGFKLVDLGTRKECEINSKEIKTSFFGYDIAVGLASICAGGNYRRKYFALVYNFPKEKD